MTGDGRGIVGWLEQLDTRISNGKESHPDLLILDLFDPLDFNAERSVNREAGFDRVDRYADMVENCPLDHVGPPRLFNSSRAMTMRWTWLVPS